MAFDTGDDNGSETNESTETTDNTESVDSEVSVESGDKGTELVSNPESGLTGKGTELVEGNPSPSPSKGAELCESNEKTESIPYSRSNEKGEVLEGAPTLRDEAFAVKDEKGNPQLDRNGNPIPDYAGQAPNNGFKESPEELQKNGSHTLTKGSTIVRYGSERGSFVTDTGTPYSSLSLPYDENSVEYHEYTVNSDIACTKGTVAPAFGEKGGGVQYMTNESIGELVKSGALTRTR